MECADRRPPLAGHGALFGQSFPCPRAHAPEHRVRFGKTKLGGALFRQRLLCFHHIRLEHLGLCGELGTVQHKVRRSSRVDAPGLKAFTFLWIFFDDDETGGMHITQRTSLTGPSLISAVRQLLRPRGCCRLLQVPSTVSAVRLQSCARPRWRASFPDGAASPS